MKFLFLLFAFLSIHFHTKAQPSENQAGKSDQAVYLEAFGIGGLYSVNYERMLLQRGDIALAGSVGFTFTPRISGFSDDSFGPGIPLEINFLYGQNHHLEFGAGLTTHYVFYRPKGPVGLRVVGNDEFEYIYDDPEEYFIGWASMRVGYRYQKPGSGFLFRLGFTPLLPFGGSEGTELDFVRTVVPMGGISFGYTF